MNKTNALNLLLSSRRLDLISKYLYLKNLDSKSSFYKELYLAYIEAFNGFYEKPATDESAKIGEQAFLDAFLKIYNSIKDSGFNSDFAIPVSNNEPQDGAHRLASCAVLNQDIVIDFSQNNNGKIYDYKFFQKKGLDQKYLDFCALEYVKLNPKTYIVNLHATNNIKYDKQVEEILNKYGYVYYKKDIWLNYNGYVNIKKLSYGSDNWGKESWIGTSENNFKGAQHHAKKSYGDGKNPLRAYVFVCNELENVLKAKAEIREIFKIGNESIHINDSRKEAIELAQTYFNDNSIKMINSRPFNIDTIKLDNLLCIANEELNSQNIDRDCITFVGSAPLCIFGLRDIYDLDFINISDKIFKCENNELSEQHEQLELYNQNKFEMCTNPKYHFYYKGYKFITLEVLKGMKQNRNQIPKDLKDIKLIEKCLNGTYKPNKFVFMLPKIIKKEKYGLNRTIVLFGFIKFSYKKKNKK